MSITNIELTRLVHYMNDGTETSLKAYFIEFDYQQDLFMFTHSGSITLLDNNGIVLERMQLYDKIEIHYKDTFFKERMLEMYIYNIKELFNHNNVSRTYKIGLCDKLLLDRPSIVKQYNNVSVNDVLTSVLSDYCNIDTYNYLDLVNNGNDRVIDNITLSNIKPLETIGRLCSEYKNSKGLNDMLFFQCHDLDKDYYQNRYVFKSLSDIYTDDIISTYKLKGNKVNITQSEVGTFFDSIDYRIIQQNNTFTMENNTVSGEVTNTLDLFNHVYNINPTNSNNHSDNSLLNSIKTHKSLRDNNQKRNIEFVLSDDRHDIIGTRKNMLAKLLYGNKVIMEIQPNNMLTVGMVINLESYIGSVSDVSLNNNRVKEDNYSGKYIITAIRQKMTGFSMRMSVELSTDSGQFK